MGLLRRLLGGGSGSTDEPQTSEPDATTPEAGDAADGDQADAPSDATERAYELEVLREEQERMSDLAVRQLRYAKYAWTPPAQGGARRAEDADTETEPADAD